jgi:hypothetical protein
MAELQVIKSPVSGYRGPSKSISASPSIFSRVYLFCVHPKSAVFLSVADVCSVIRRTVLVVSVAKTRFGSDDCSLLMANTGCRLAALARGFRPTLPAVATRMNTRVERTYWIGVLRLYRSDCLEFRYPERDQRRRSEINVVCG